MKETTRFAGLWPRFLALLVDFVLFCAVFIPATRFVKGIWIMSATDHRWNYGLFITDPLCIAFLVVMVLYFVFLEGLFQVRAHHYAIIGGNTEQGKKADPDGNTQVDRVHLEQVSQVGSEKSDIHKPFLTIRPDH